MACTDDLFATTLVEEGGIDHLLRRLIAVGMPPVRALRTATYNAAYRLRRSDLGLVAAGRRADVVVLSSLDDVTVDDVYTDGRHVASGGRMLVASTEGPSTPPLNTVHLNPIEPADLALRLPGITDGRVRIRVIDGIVNTTWASAEVDVVGGVAQIPDGMILQAVVHRHGRVAPEVRVALASGWGGDWTGAIAATVSHDTHNLVLFGRDMLAMATAANVVIPASLAPRRRCRAAALPSSPAAPPSSRPAASPARRSA